MQLREVAGELLEDLGSLDSRLWRTLRALLFKPGFLSAEFNAGRKVAYIPPFRLYLVISFIMFLMLSVSTELEVSVELENDPSSVQIREDSADDFSFNISDSESPEWLQKLELLLETNAERAEEDSADFEQRLLEFLPQLVFVLVPLLALLIHLCYLGKPYHYLQHLVFALHFNCFMFSIAIFSFLLDELAGFSMQNFMLPLVYVYLPLALKRCYGDSVGRAIFKGLFILTANGIFVVFGLAGLSIIALLTI